MNTTEVRGYQNNSFGASSFIHLMYVLLVTILAQINIISKKKCPSTALTMEFSSDSRSSMKTDIASLTASRTNIGL